MPEDSVICPKCGERISLTAAVTGSIEARLRKRLVAEVEERERDLDKREEKLRTSAKKVEERVERLVEERFDEQTPKLKERLLREIAEEKKGEFDELRNRLNAREERLKIYEKREREFVDREEGLAERERRLGLDAKQALDKERAELVERVRGEESERWEGQLREKQTELDRVNQALERAQKAGASGELAGEVAERTLLERLSDSFTEDQVSSVGRGKQGADVLHSVLGGGLILWESKDRYENWSNEWIPKLKRDRDEARASVGVLVTTIGPGSKPVRAPSFEDGVVLTPPGLVVGVASLLRPMLGEISRQRRLYDKQESLQEAVYAWVTSQAFKNGITAIAENLWNLEREVARAKVNHAKWFKRMEVGVERTTRALGEFYGTAQGQARLPDLPILSLPDGSGGPRGQDAPDADGSGPEDPSTDS